MGKNSAKEIIKSKIPLDYIKVPSACNQDFELLNYLAKKFKKKIHISLGMTKYNEINNIFKFFKKSKKNKNVVFYSCTSDYPASFDTLCILEIERLRRKYKEKIFDIAFSGHHLGISVDIAAYILGAKYIERHFSLKQNLERY